jgi:hypothetical protein
MRGVINRSGMEPVTGKVRQSRDAKNQHYYWLSLARITHEASVASADTRL